MGNLWEFDTWPSGSNYLLSMIIIYIDYYMSIIIINIKYILIVVLLDKLCHKS